jgi:hypothetical protein
MATTQVWEGSRRRACPFLRRRYGSLMRPVLLDWLGVSLAFIGVVFALVASVIGIRTRRVTQETKDAQWVHGPAEVIRDVDRIVDGVRWSSWVLLFASLSVLFGVAVQVTQLVRRY